MEECETQEQPREKEKQNPRRLLTRAEGPSVSFSKPKKRIFAPQEKLAHGAGEERAGSSNLPKRKEPSPTEEAVRDPEEAGNR